MALPPPPSSSNREGASPSGSTSQRGLPPPPAGASIAANITPQPQSGPSTLPVEAPPPRAPSKPLNRAMLFGVIGGVAALALGIVGFISWQRIAGRPGTAELKNHLATQLAESGIQIAQLDTKFSPAMNGSVPIAFTVQGTAREELYRAKPDNERTLQELGSDPALYRKARALLNSRAGKRLRELAGNPLDLADLQKVTFLEKATAAGTPITYAGTAFARRQGTLWVFSVADAVFITGKPEGKRRADFATPTFVTKDPAEEAKFKAYFAQLTADAQKIVAASEQYQAELEKLKAERQAGFLANIATGALFTGTATRKGDVQSFPVSLEITELATRSRKVTALLRNDGGWTDARIFKGEWTTDKEVESLTLALVTQPNQAIRDAGPILQDANQYTMPLTMDEQGGLAGDTDNWAYRFSRVLPDQLAATKQELSRNLTEAIDATKVDRFYRGTIVANSTHTAEAVLLHFVKQQDQGAQLVAKIESTDNPWVRTLSGTIVSNRYRAGDTPVRLRLLGADRAPAANNRSFFGYGWDRDLAFRLEGEQLSADDGEFTFKLERASDEFVADLLKTRQLRAQHVAATFRTGAVYDGVLRNSEGYAHRVRMRIINSNAAEATVKLAIDSREQAGISHEFSGGIERITGSVLLHSSGKGRLNPSGILKVPFFSRDAEFGLSLAIQDEQIAASVNDQPWTGEFTIRAASAQVTGTGRAVDGAGGYPTEHGAYVWQDGIWKKLPANKCKPTVGALGQVTNVLSGLNGMLGAFSGKKPAEEELRKPDKLGDLEFSGLDEVPVVDGTNVTVVFIGSIPAIPSNVLAQYPDLRKYPKVEMAPTRVGTDGKRRADLIRIVPGIAGFRDTRVAATVEEISPEVTELRCTSTITPGAYAFTAGTEGFEVNIE